MSEERRSRNTIRKHAFLSVPSAGYQGTPLRSQAANKKGREAS
ncbi:MAG: hypothetical protein ABEH38_07790 [Flavobacteriales bacterium]